MKVKLGAFFIVISLLNWFQFDDFRKSNLANYLNFYSAAQEDTIENKLREYLLNRDKAVLSFYNDLGKLSNFWVMNGNYTVVTECPKTSEYKEELTASIKRNDPYLYVKLDEGALLFNWKRDLRENEVVTLGTCSKISPPTQIKVVYSLAGQIILFFLLFYTNVSITLAQKQTKDTFQRLTDTKAMLTSISNDYTDIQTEYFKAYNSFLAVLQDMPVPVIITDTKDKISILNDKAKPIFSISSLPDLSKEIVTYKNKQYSLSRLSFFSCNVDYTLTFALDLTDKANLSAFKNEIDLLFNNNSIVYLTWDISGSILHASPSFEKTLGYGYLPNIYTITYKDDIAKLKKSSAKGLDDVEIRLSKKNLTYKWFTCFVRFSDGKYFGVFYDATEMKRIKENSVADKVLYRNIYDTSFMGILRVNALTDKILSCNDKFAHILGYEGKHSLINIISFKTLFVDDLDCEKLYAQLYHKGFIEEEEVLMKSIREGGKNVWVKVAMSFIEVDNEIECCCIESGKEKDMQHRLNCGYRLFRNILNYVPIHIVGVDASNVIIFCNNAFASIHNIAAVELLGYSMRALHPDRDISLLNYEKCSTSFTEEFEGKKLITHIIKVDVLESKGAYCYISSFEGFTLTLEDFACIEDNDDPWEYLW